MMESATMPLPSGPIMPHLQRNQEHPTPTTTAMPQHGLASVGARRPKPTANRVDRGTDVEQVNIMTLD
jgi:hypothetical protein